jgi:hypothetical protein
MNGRVIVAGLLGGLALFLWGTLSHMALGLGELGVSKFPNEAAVLASLGEQVKEGGLYVFPMEEDPAKWEEVFARYPSGVASIQPPGSPLAFGRRLGVELATNVLGTLLAVLLLGGLAARTLETVGQRAMTGATLGAFASISIDASYWNWYNFPSAYLVGQFLDQTIGWAIAMVIAGWWLARRS